jgi:aryl-alcohol dehydrogenase-like predicted oxidoreductase
MKYQLFGNSGLRVSEVCLGTMTFGEDWGWESSEAEARKIYDRFREHGGNFIDTANLYTLGTSEKMLGGKATAFANKGYLCVRFLSTETPLATGSRLLYPVLNAPFTRDFC